MDRQVGAMIEAIHDRDLEHDTVIILSAKHGRRVETTQIAPTILQLLGLDPDALKAVRIEHTAALRLG